MRETKLGSHSEISNFQKQRRDESALPFGGEHHSTPRQILIEARIVEADHRFARNLGVKLGMRPRLSSLEESHLQMSVPLNAGGLGGFEPASAAATLLSKHASRLLDIELTALESDGQGKILSNPRIMTADMVKATIEQGTELPYQTSSSSGGNKIQFRKANLRLEVIPKIHHDGKVSLLVAINKDSFVFESVEKVKIRGRYTIFGFNPDQIIEVHNNNIIKIENGKKNVIKKNQKYNTFEQQGIEPL